MMSIQTNCDAASSVQLTCWISAFATFDHVQACFSLQNRQIVRPNVRNVARANRATPSRCTDDHVSADPADRCAT